MGAPDLQHLLQLTRAVFAGRVNRAQLAKRSNYESAFVGTAIILIVRKGLVDDYNVVLEPYSHMLERLLSYGTVRRSLGRQPGYKYGSALAIAARTLELYDSVPKRGSAKSNPVKLKPPPELSVLLRELGCTRHVRAFLRDAQAGAERERQWDEEHRTMMKESKERSEMAGIGLIVDDVERRLGREGLLELKRVTEQHLEA